MRTSSQTERRGLDCAVVWRCCWSAISGCVGRAQLTQSRANALCVRFKFYNDGWRSMGRWAVDSLASTRREKVESA